MVVVGAATIGGHAFAVIRKKTTSNRMTKNVENGGFEKPSGFEAPFVIPIPRVDWGMDHEAAGFL